MTDLADVLGVKLSIFIPFSALVLKSGLFLTVVFPSVSSRAGKSFGYGGFAEANWSYGKYRLRFDLFLLRLFNRGGRLNIRVRRRLGSR